MYAVRMNIQSIFHKVCGIITEHIGTISGTNQTFNNGGIRQLSVNLLIML